MSHRTQGNPPSDLKAGVASQADVEARREFA